jgi:hypothetical protein
MAAIAATTTTTTDDRLLRLAGLALFAGLVVHNGDHARRSLAGVADGVVWGGTLAVAVAAVTLTLIATRHPLAPSAAVVAGLSIAIGVSASHLLPAWGPISDPLAEDHVGLVTWLAVLAEIAGALFLGLAGLAGLRRQGFAVRR